MALNPNQFTQIPVQGQVDLMYGPTNVVGAAVSSNIATNGVLIAGQAVKLDTTLSGGVPKVLPLTANTDPIFGFIPFNIKDISRGTGQNVEVALPGTYMYMTTSAAVTIGASLEYDYATNTVKTWAGVNPIFGTAYDAGAASGALIRVLISKPSTGTGDGSNSVSVVATLAQINAGLVIIPGVAGKKLQVTNYVARVSGTFLTGTAVVLESTNVTPVVVTSLAEAGLTNGAVLLPASANTTLGAGYAAPMGTGDGLQVVNSGSNQTGGTSIAFTIDYNLV